MIGIDLQDGLSPQLVSVQDNFADTRSHLVGERNRRFEAQPDSPLAAAGFEAIDRTSIGPVNAKVFVTHE